jgi:hypothetical protein
LEAPERGEPNPKKLKIAFYCWVKGYFEPTNARNLEAMGEKDMETIETVKERIQRRSLPGYATEDFWEAVSMWRDYSEFGYPDAGGANDQGALWLDVVRLMKECAKSMGVT